jgi:hypothetical protein
MAEMASNAAALMEMLIMRGQYRPGSGRPQPPGSASRGTGLEYGWVVTCGLSFSASLAGVSPVF